MRGKEQPSGIPKPQVFLRLHLAKGLTVRKNLAKIAKVAQKQTSKSGKKGDGSSKDGTGIWSIIPEDGIESEDKELQISH